MAECIHGFDDGLCDTCFPKAPPERPAAARPASRSVAGSAPRREARATTAPRKVSAPPPNLLDQRVYHVTHVSNLVRILEAGLVAPALAMPEVDVSSALTRELRETAIVTGGGSVAEYVPFHLAADSTAWLELRGGAAQPRWSAQARAASSTDFLFLVSTVRAVSTQPADVAVSDGDASATLTRFATGDAVIGMLSRLHGSTQAVEAELLVRQSVPMDAVQLIGVANDPVRDRVRELLETAGRRTKVAVYPPWFIES